MGTFYVCLFWYPKWLTKQIIGKYINIFLNVSMPFLPRVLCLPLNSSRAERQATSSSHCFAPFHKIKEIKCRHMKVDQLYIGPLEKNLSNIDMQLLQIWLINQTYFSITLLPDMHRSGGHCNLLWEELSSQYLYWLLCLLYVIMYLWAPTQVFLQSFRRGWVSVLTSFVSWAPALSCNKL